MLPMLKISRFLVLAFLTLLTAFGAIACNNREISEAGTVIRIGSKDFAEQFILGEMYALALEESGVTVERKLNLGGTPVAQASLEAGEIDLYPEYTGTGLLTILKLPSSSDRAQVYQTVAGEYRDRFNLVWLDPSPMSNSQALIMTQEGSEKHGIQTISELVTKADQLTMIGPPEFQVREDGLPGLKAGYGEFELQEYKAVDPGLRYQGLVNGDADVAVGFSTDGEISALNLRVLEDDKNLFPPYQVAPVVRQEVLENNPEISSVLNRVTGQITNEVMRRLNYEVTGNQREPVDVARDFLRQAEILEN